MFAVSEENKPLAPRTEVTEANRGQSQRRQRLNTASSEAGTCSTQKADRLTVDNQRWGQRFNTESTEAKAHFGGLNGNTVHESRSPRSVMCFGSAGNGDSVRPLR